MEKAKVLADPFAGVDLGSAIQKIAAEGLLIKGGGHKMAAGLTVKSDQIEAAMTRLADLLSRQGAGATGPTRPSD